ncbi:MAG: amino acid adenylation domain-containing protein [Deltaproteobacteria bacterium]|nr:amino acid adenylation domain-containing protein [Deltaproteobacteria bacterium]
MSEPREGAEVLKKALVELKRLKAEREARHEPVAIIGASCRFPGGVVDLESYWQVLHGAVDTIQPIPHERWDVAAHYDPERDRPGKMYVREGGFIAGIDHFDARFFGISPREATAMDPQQRLLLELAWEALEQAGLPMAQLSGSKTGVFIGQSSSDYLQLMAQRGYGEDSGYVLTGVVPSIAAGRISHALGLLGPNLLVDTACSSSLIATQLAVRALRTGECSLALVGGVNAILAPQPTAAFCQLHALSPDSRCKTFDASANGYVRSEGCGMVVLKRLSDALRDRDRIYAVIRGVASNHDGRSSGLTVPSGSAQQEVLRSALADAGLGPRDVAYLEAHGTGTPLGDPVEIRAAAAVYGTGRAAEDPLYVGSAKANLGHLEAAAGVAALLKATLVLDREEIPPQLHFHTPNPHLGLEALPLAVPTRPRPFLTNGKLRRVAVSAFGFSGSNAHVILEEAPRAEEQVVAPARYVLVLSAKTEAALLATARRHLPLLEGIQPDTLVRLVATLACRRTHHEYRLGVVGQDAGELQAGLQAWLDGQPHRRVVTGRAPGSAAPPVFVYSGQGTAHAEMARGLGQDPVFTSAFQQVVQALGRAGLPGLEGAIRDPAALARTRWAQPAIFAVQVGLTAWWRAHGVEPEVVVGHSVGEIAAAHAAGILDLDAAARLVVARAELMDLTTGQGRMLAVALPAEEARSRFPELELAADNGPRSAVLAGPASAVESARRTLQAAGLEATDLGVDYAFHTAAQDRAAEALYARPLHLEPRAGQASFCSTVTATLQSGAHLDLGYWARNLRQPVQFRGAIDSLARRGHSSFLELGAHPALGGAIDSSTLGKALVTSTLRKGQDDQTELHLALARLHVLGVAIDWSVVNPARVRPLPLPAYPWEHRRFWALDGAITTRAPEAQVAPLLGVERRSAAFGGTVFEADLSASSPAYLGDHAMYGVTLLPAAGFLEMFRAAVAQVRGPGPVQLGRIEVRSPLTLDGSPRRVQTVVDAQAVKVYSLDEGRWRLHAEAKIEDAGLPKAVDWPATQLALDPLERYRRSVASGVGLGPAFQVLTELAIGDQVARATARLPDGVQQGPEPNLHPALLDACFQAGAAAFGEKRLAGRILLPVAIASAHLQATGPGLHRAQFRLTQLGPEFFEGEAQLFDAEERCVAHLVGVRFQLAQPSSLSRGPNVAGAPSWLQWSWRAAPRLAAVDADRRFLVFGAEGRSLALKDAGAILDPRHPTDLVLEDASAAAFLEAWRAHPEVQRVHLLGRLDDPQFEGLRALARTLHLEREGPAVHWIALEPGADPIPELRTPSLEREVHLDPLERRVARLISAERAPVAPWAARADGSYLIAGGLGALGLATAQWLADRGARQIGLFGRHGPKDQDRAALQALEARGVALKICPVDLSDASGVAQAVQALEVWGGPVRGVFHAAGVLEDALLEAVTPAQLQRVKAPKFAGAVHLAHALEGRPLDFFLAYSSLAATLGSPGQAAYTAANGALEGLMASWRRQGQPAYAIAFGPWSLGMAATTRARPGLSSLSPELALAAVAELLSGPPRSVSVAALSWPQLLSALGARRPAFLEGFGPTASARPAALRTALLAAPDEERPVHAERLVAQQVRQILGLAESEPIDPSADLVQLGLDSLMALELRDRLEAGLGRSLPQSATFERRAVKPLAELVLTLLEDQHEAPQISARTITPDLAGRHQPFPLSDVQAAYWLGRTGGFELGGTSCHYYGELERTGLDVERLSRSWQLLIQRHEMLRAVIEDDGQQHILPNTPAYTLDVRDLRGRTPAEVSSALAQTRAELSHQVFDPKRWPLFDLRVHRLDGDRTRLHLSIDLLIMDVSSFVGLLTEWRRLYEGEALEPITLSFRDYQLWERAQESTPAFEASLAHWRERITTMPEGPQLPLARAPKDVGRPQFTRRERVLAPQQWSRLKERARQAGLTPAMVVAAAYAHVLERWSKSKAFTLNLTLFNRAPVHPEVNRVVGDFTSLILLEVDHRGAGNFVERAKALQARLRQDLPHRQVTGVRVLREWSKQKGRIVGAPVVFTSGIGMTDGLQAEADRTDAWFGESVYSVSQTPQVWLDHQVYERQGKLLLYWDAVEALFPEGLLDEMFEAYGALLESLTEDDSVWTQPRLPLVSTKALAPRRQANQTDGPVPAGLLHSALAEQARRRPDAPAVIGTDRTLSYAALEAAALRVAAELRARGLLPGDRVAIHLPKSAAQIIAVLGVLEADGVYVPVALSQPRERVEYLLANTEARFILTEPGRAAGPWPSGVTALGVEAEPFPDRPPVRLPNERQPTDLAYIIYTSGSTGRPKGVMIDHRGALNTIIDLNQRFGVGHSDRIFGVSDLGFDLSVYDLFGTLAAGATLVLPEEAGLRDPSHWMGLLSAHRVSLWNSVPALAKMLFEYLRGVGDAHLPPSLRLVFLSGDWIPLDLPSALHAARPGVEVIGMGGATEASIWSNLHPIGAIDPSWKSIPYGRPLRNQRYFVLDELGQESPTWVPGQLHIGGVGVALGYFGDEARTRAKFVLHPETGERLYATGDLGRYWPDGTLEFLGREDFQLKLQGHRIELGEIEGVLLEHPQVAGAIVTTYEARPGDRQLAAYVIPKDEPVDPQTLRAHLGQRLPSYMVPRSYTSLTTFPLSSNGKVDRAALPSPVAVTRSIRGPSNETERKIAAVWSKILGRPNVAVDESFFDAGGDSQLAVRAMLELREALGRELPIRALFETPTIEGLAQALGSATQLAPVQVPEERLYAHYARRGIGERLWALGTDKSYVQAEGNRLWYERDGQRVEVLDMVGGYGSAILGHNHPEIVELAQSLLRQKEPFHAQYTNNRAVGRLCKALSDRLELATGSPFVITLASTGTEAIEAALKHAKMEYRARAQALAHSTDSVAAVIIDQELKGKSQVAPELYQELKLRFGIEVDTLAGAYDVIVRANQQVCDEEPIFLALEHCFHGMTTGALSLTASADFRAPFHWMGVRALRLPQTSEALEQAVDAQRSELYSLGFDAGGRTVLRTQSWHRVAGLFLEPIQGEGGIRPLEPEFLKAARAQADRAAFPLIVDEIQCGMGRSGRFFASELVGLKGDYYTMSKSLGGGASKVSAMAVLERRYQPEFGYVHGSTFAEDGVSASLALKTLELIDRDRLLEAAEQKGRLFRQKLSALQARYPNVIKSVRGAGLMLGIQIATQEESPSLVLRVVSQSDPEMFNQLLAGYLLNEHDLRIAPTKTRSTIRFLPSAYVTEAEMDRVVAAFGSVCELIEKVNIGRLLRHLVVPEADRRDPIRDWRTRYPAWRDDAPRPGERRVAHVAHVEDDETLLLTEPSLAEIPADRRRDLLWRLFRFTRPAIGQRLRITTATGESVHLSLLGLIITGEIFESMMKSEDRALVVDKIQEAVDVAIAQGCEVIGFGGYTSIVTLNCTAVATPRAALTSGNAFTVALAVEGALLTAAERGLDLSRCRVAVVGGAGNIGSVAAKIMAEHAGQVVLIGRDAQDPRLHSVANQIFCNAEDALLAGGGHTGVAAAIRPSNAAQSLLRGGQPIGGATLRRALEEEHGGQQGFVTVTNDLSVLKACEVIITCTSTAGSVIRPEHLSERVQVICDVATPKDVDPSVLAAFPGIKVISGGLAQLPGQNGVQLYGTHLPPDHLYGCVAETALLGVDGRRAHFSFGEISRDQVEHIRALARRHGFVVGRVEQR